MDHCIAHRHVKNSDQQVARGDHELIDLDDTRIASQPDYIAKASISDMNDFISVSSI